MHIITLNTGNRPMDTEHRTDNYERRTYRATNTCIESNYHRTQINGHNTWDTDHRTDNTEMRTYSINSCTQNNEYSVQRI